MSIVANAPRSFIKLRRSGMFVLRFMESFNVRQMCIGTMNLVFHGSRLCRRPTAASLELQRFMESLVLLRTCIGTLNRFAKLRRSAMSIAANAPWFLLKLRRSGMFVRRFMESFNVRRTCIATMNRPGFLPLLHWRRGTGRGGRCIIVATRFLESLVSLRACIVTMNLKTSNPKGIPPQSPGLPSLRGYPGLEATGLHNPERVAPDVRYRLATVHGKFQHSRNAHCNHEPHWSSPSPQRRGQG